MHAGLPVFIVILGWLLLALATLGTLYTIAAALLFRRFFARPAPAPPRDEAVTLLKPLHGAEPRLADNLATFLQQDHHGPIQLLCGVASLDDPAAAAVKILPGTGRGTARRVVEGGCDTRCVASAESPLHRLRRSPSPCRGGSVDLVIDPTRHGASGKVGNLVNLQPHAAHDILILSDSDIAVAPDYLARVLAALDAPGVGAVTCLYRGRGDAGFWSRLAAAGLSYQFLPGALFGVATGIAHPCMGSTIALRRDTLERIGGFARFADTLADDHAIGAAVESLGLRVVVPPMLVTHACAETNLAALWRHELRWGATVRGVAPAAHAASVIALPLPLALIGVGLAPGLPGLGAVAAALAARFALAWTIDRQVGEGTASPLLLPLRDCLSFAIFLASFCVRSVDWRGSRLRIRTDGRIAAEPEIR